MEQLDLSDLFTTRAEANDFLARINTISEMLFKTDFNLEKVLIEQLGINKGDRFLTILRENNINVSSTQAIKIFFHTLSEKILAMPVIALTVAFEPQAQTLKAVSEWFVINMKQQMLFDITVDRKIVGGAAVTYNGKFFDFSIRQTFERIMQNYLTRHTQAHAAVAQIAKTTTQQANQNDIHKTG